MENDEQSVRQFVSTWVSAAENGDNELVLSLIAEDAIFLTPGQPPMSKSDFAVAQSGLKEMRLHMTSEIQDVKVCGEWAYCWNKLAIDASPLKGGASIKRSGNTLSVLKKHHGSSFATQICSRLLHDVSMLPNSLQVAPKTRRALGSLCASRSGALELRCWVICEALQ